MIKLKYAVNFFSVLFMFWVIFFSSSLFSSNLLITQYDEIELETLRNILHRQKKFSIQDLEKEFISNEFQCQRFQNSCSGNIVLKLKGKSPYVVKILNKPEAERSNEIAITQIAGNHFLAPEVLFSGDTEDYRYMVMEFLESFPLSQVMSWLNIDWYVMNDVIKRVRSLHDSSAYFPPTTTIYEHVRDHFKLIEKHAIPVPKEYKIMKDSFDGLMCALVRLEHYKPCHFDLHGDNIFIAPKTIKLIDWDCAGTGNIYLELAAISLNFRFSEGDDQKMLKTYFPSTSSEEEAYFYIAKTLCLGVYSVREFIRPYFQVFPPFLSLGEVKQEDYQLISQLSTVKHAKYDEVLAQNRRGEILNYDSDLKIGFLILHEYIQRLRSQKMQDILFFLREKSYSGRLIMANNRLYKSYLKSFFSNNPHLISLYYNSM